MVVGAAVLLLAGAVGSARAETEVFLDIAVDETWTVEGSPYRVSVDITIEDTATVTIEPGVQVILEPTINMLINGKVLANGTVEKPIRIGGTSEGTRGGTITLRSGLTSEFKYCHFTHMSQIRVNSTAPHGNHLVQHCVLRDFSSTAIYMEDSPLRVLDNIFRANSGWAVQVDYYDVASFTDENTPQIWYNVADEEGFHIYANGTLGNRLFFRYNRVTGGSGIVFSRCSSITITDCDLIRCATSIQFDRYCNTMTVLDCDLWSISGTDAAPRGTYRNCYWGSTDINEIYDRIQGVDSSTQKATPFETDSVFPQADVDNSDANNSTAQNDADMVKQSLVGLVTLTPTQRDIADVDGSGDVDIRDALIIESFVHGMIWKLPDQP